GATGRRSRQEPSGHLRDHECRAGESPVDVLSRSPVAASSTHADRAGDAARDSGRSVQGDRAGWHHPRTVSGYRLARMSSALHGRSRRRRMKKRLLDELGNDTLFVLGILSAGMGLKGFLMSSHFIDGGVTGVSMLLAQTTGLPLAFWLPVV